MPRQARVAGALLGPVEHGLDLNGKAGLRPLTHPRLYALAFAFVALLAVIAPDGVRAQQQQIGRIVASVNDAAITDYDVSARGRMLATSANLTVTTENQTQIARQALRELIDERLKTQEAERLGIRVSDQEVGAAIRTIERNNRMEQGELFRELTQKGVPVETLIDQIRATLGWRKVLRQRVLPQVRVASEEVDVALARIREAGGGAILRASEVFLPAETQTEFEEARRAALAIRQQATDALAFSRLAAQFSRAPTAAVGGDLGEIQPGQLNPVLEEALMILAPGETSPPISTERGIYLLFLRERRSIEVGAPEMAVVTLARAFLPIRSDTEAAAAGTSLTNAVAGAQGCDAFERAANAMRPGQPPRVVDARIGDLPEELRDNVAGLQPGETTEPIPVGDGIAVIMLCRRAESGGTLPSAERVAEAIQNQRAERRAERYLRDLRRVAFIDIRG